MKLVIRSYYDNLPVLSTVDNVTVAPQVGSTVSTNEGVFVIKEIGFNYILNEINCYSHDYCTDTEEVRPPLVPKKK